MRTNPKKSVSRIAVLFGLTGIAVASLLAAGWYSPLVLDRPVYRNMLTGVSVVLWPTARLVGGWVGPWEPFEYWFRVIEAIAANGCVYAAVGGGSISLIRRIKNKDQLHIARDLS